MVFTRCPRCELNYLMNGEKICSVCRKELSGVTEQDDILELCSECGENPVVPGGELCAQCLKENARRNVSNMSDDTITTRNDKTLDVNAVTEMDVIELDDDFGDPFVDDDEPFDDGGELDDEDLKDDEDDEDDEDEDDEF